MSTLLLVAALGQAPTVTLQAGAFRLQAGDKAHTVPIHPKQLHGTLKGTFLWTENGVRVVFDKGGLRAGKVGALQKVSLRAFATSPRFQSAAQIRETASLIGKGVRSAEPSALSGYEVVGKGLVLLLRWEDRAGKPWLEALATLADGGSGMKATGLGRFDGIGFATGLVDDELFGEGGRLLAPTNFEGRFGIASTDERGGARRFRPLGDEVGGVAWRPGLPEAFVTRPVGEGNIGVSCVDTANGSWRSLLEYRGKIGNLLPEGWAKLVMDGKPWAANLWTGARTPIAANANMEHTPFGLLVWAPSSDPKQAWLLDANVRQISAWRSPPPAQ